MAKKEQKLAMIHPFDATKSMSVLHLLQSEVWVQFMIDQIKDQTKKFGWKENKDFMTKTRNVLQAIKYYNHCIKVDYKDDELYEITANVSDQICKVVNLSSEDRAKVYELIEELSGTQSKFTTDHSELIKEFLSALDEKGIKYSKIVKSECIGAIVLGGEFPTIEDAYNAQNELSKLNVKWQYPCNLISSIKK